MLRYHLSSAHIVYTDHDDSYIRWGIRLLFKPLDTCGTRSTTRRGTRLNIRQLLLVQSAASLLNAVNPESQ